MATYNDFEIEEMLPKIDELIRSGVLVYLKWTCPKCGERVTANEPNTYRTQGYQHEERLDGIICGEWYYGTKFNYLVHWKGERRK